MLRSFRLQYTSCHLGSCLWRKKDFDYVFFCCCKPGAYRVEPSLSSGMGQCLAKSQERGKRNEIMDSFPDNYTESQICDYYVDRLPHRLVGEGIHLLRGGPGPIVCSWTHELLNDAGVHSYQDRELLLRARDEIVAAVEGHRLRLGRPGRTSCSGCRSRGSLCGPPSEVGAAFANSSTSAAAGASNGVDATCGSLKPLWGSGGSIADQGAEDGASGAQPRDKAAARRAQEAAAAAAAADAAASTTAFRSGGDGKSFRLTTDWLPAGLQLYRISEEFRHMTSSGLGSDGSVHSKMAGILDMPASAKAAGGVSPLTKRKSRFGAATTLGSSASAGRADEAERDGDGGVADRDAEFKPGNAVIAAMACMELGHAVPIEAAVECLPSRGTPTAAAPTDGSALVQVPVPAIRLAGCGEERGDTVTSATSVGAGRGCSCGSGSGSGGGSGGEESGSSPGSTLGAESLAALTALEAPSQPPNAASPLPLLSPSASPRQPPNMPSLLAAEGVSASSRASASPS